MEENIVTEAQKILNTTALETAVRAESKVDMSAVIDTERYNTLIDKIDGLKEKINDVKTSQDVLFKRWWSVAGSIILLLISGVAYLFGKAYP